MAYLKSRSKRPKSTPPPPFKSREERERKSKEAVKPGRSSKKADRPEDGEDIRVAGLSDQRSEKWLAIAKGKDTALASLASHFQGGMWKELADQGVVITRSKSRSQVCEQIEGIRDWPQGVYVADRPGYHCGAHVKPDGAIIGKPTVENFRVVFRQPSVDLDQAGDFAEWQQAIQTFVNGQSIFTLALCLAFVGPIVELEPGASNPCIDLFGPSSIGKSTALDVGSSVWGAPLKLPGSLALSLRITVAAMEQHMCARSGSMMPGDEVNLLGFDPRQQGPILADLAMALAEGVEKHRHRDPGAVGLRYGCLITSNTPFGQLIRGADQSNREAALARMISVPADSGRGDGVWSTLPDGYADGKAASLALRQALIANHGHAADKFLRRFVRSRKRDESGLRAKIERHRDIFLKQIQASDPVLGRRAESISYVYAAGALASEWGIIPLRRVAIRSALFECWGRSQVAYADANASSSTALQRVQAYVAAHQHELVDLDQTPFSELSKTELDSHPGFLKTRRRRPCLFLRTARWDDLFGLDGYNMLVELEQQQRLQVTDGRQLQVQVRSNRQHDRVYAVMID